MLLLIVAIIHLYFSKKTVSAHTNITRKSPMLYQTKRAMMNVDHWKIAQTTYKKLNQIIFKVYVVLALPLTAIDFYMIISFRNGTLLIAEALLYIVTLIFIYLTIEHKLKNLS